MYCSNCSSNIRLISQSTFMQYVMPKTFALSPATNGKSAYTQSSLTMVNSSFNLKKIVKYKDDFLSLKKDPANLVPSLCPTVPEHVKMIGIKYIFGLHLCSYSLFLFFLKFYFTFGHLDLRFNIYIYNKFCYKKLECSVVMWYII